MPKQIDQDKCIRCGTCQSECPNGGIAEVDGDYQIDAGLCTDCFGFYEQSHCMEMCPADAISDVPGTADSDENVAAAAAALRPEAFPRD